METELTDGRQSRRTSEMTDDRLHALLPDMELIVRASHLPLTGRPAVGRWAAAFE